jgi:hypothetical protein
MWQHFGYDIFKPSPPAFPKLDLARKPQGLRAFYCWAKYMPEAARAPNNRSWRIRPAFAALILIKQKILLIINGITIVIPAYPQYCPR